MGSRCGTGKNSEHEKEEDENDDLDDNDEPQVAVVRRLQQMLHLVVSVDHVLLGSVDVVPQLLDLLVLRLNLLAEVLSLVLRRLHNSNNFVQLAVLVLYQVFLKGQYLSVFQVAGLVKLIVFSSLVPILVLLGGQSSLIVLNASVLLSELAHHKIFDFVDEGDSTSDLFFVHSRVLVRLILVVVHQLVEVAHVGLEGRPGCLHEVLLAGHGLAGSGVGDLIDLAAQSLDAFLCLPVVSFELVSAHCFGDPCISYN